LHAAAEPSFEQLQSTQVSGNAASMFTTFAELAELRTL
jgi:hypothetical protein